MMYLRSGAVTHYRRRRRRRPKARFYIILALIVGIILLAILWDRIAPETWATSPYWQTVLGEEG